MPLLRVIEDAPGYCKATFQGPQGSGKTFTATLLACRIHALFGSKKPIAFYDTETGSDYVADMLAQATGHKPLRIKTRAFGDLLNAGQECAAGAADIFLVDSITHVWREIQNAHMAAVNDDRARKHWEPKARMDIGDIMRIKERWQPWPDFFLNSPLHLIVCGREGGSFENQVDEETGKRELIQTGKKMKVEGEFGYEASLMVSMSIRPNMGGWVKKRGQKAGELGTHRPQEMVQVATVLKDRFDELNGQTTEMPAGEWFDPHLKRLKPALHRPVDTERRTPFEADASGYDRARADRDILCEKVEGELVRAMPGQSAAEKKLKADVLEACFRSRSWTEITTRCPLAELREGHRKLEKWMRAVDAQRRDGIDLTVAVEETRAGAFKDAERDAAEGAEAEKALGGNGKAPEAAPKPEATAPPAPAPKPNGRAGTGTYDGRGDAKKPPRAKLPTPVVTPNGTRPPARHPAGETEKAHERAAAEKAQEQPAEDLNQGESPDVSDQRPVVGRRGAR